MRFSRDNQIAADIDVAFSQHGNLIAKNIRIDDYPVTDNIYGVFIEYSGGDGVKYKFFTVKFNGVAGVGASLEAGYDIVF
jgi:hypothetical protein